MPPTDTTTADLAHRFADALHSLERTGHPADLVSLFADDAELGNASTPSSHHGRDGAEDFWAGYRGTFDDVSSEFSVIVGDDDAAALEWRTVGTLAGGSAVDYTGVTVLELSNGSVRRFTAYFDPAAIVETSP